jgi:hypothetical protein
MSAIENSHVSMLRDRIRVSPKDRGAKCPDEILFEVKAVGTGTSRCPVEG